MKKRTILWLTTVLVMVQAPWCQPCWQMKPTWEKMANRYSGKVKFVTVNGDNRGRELGQFRGVARSVVTVEFSTPLSTRLIVLEPTNSDATQA